MNFRYVAFAAVLVINGMGSGLFAPPNRAEIMNSVPADQRGAAGGMIATFQNTAFVLSIGVFFSLIVTGLASSLPSVMFRGLTAQGVPAAAAQHVAHLPPIAVLFSAFLGYNPLKQVLGSSVLSHLPAGHAAHLTSRSFFPHLMATPFHDGLSIAFGFAIAANVMAAVASAFTGTKKIRAVVAVPGGIAAVADPPSLADSSLPADAEVPGVAPLAGAEPGPAGGAGSRPAADPRAAADSPPAVESGAAADSAAADSVAADSVAAAESAARRDGRGHR